MPMTQKEEPELVTGGPYRLVRHPIYSGILAAGIGTALALSWLWLAVVVLAGVYFLYSATVEERYLTEQFPDSYPAYKRSTKMLVPFVPGSPGSRRPQAAARFVGDVGKRPRQSGTRRRAVPRIKRPSYTASASTSAPRPEMSATPLSIPSGPARPVTHVTSTSNPPPIAQVRTSHTTPRSIASQ